jgi:hypothetical protein
MPAAGREPTRFRTTLLRGNRQLNHAIHVAADCQIPQSHSDGRIYFDGKVAEGKTKKEALRALKRRVSDAMYRPAGRRRQEVGPERTVRERLAACVTGSHPEASSSAESLPDPCPPYDSRSQPPATGRSHVPPKPRSALDTQQGFDRGDAYSGDGYPLEDADPDPDVVGVQHHLQHFQRRAPSAPHRPAPTGSHAGTSGPLTPTVLCTFVGSTSCPGEGTTYSDGSEG